MSRPADTIYRIQGGYRLHGCYYRTKAEARRALRWYRDADEQYKALLWWVRDPRTF